MALFSELFELTRGATVALIITGDHEAGLMTVSVVPKPADSHNEAALSRDLTLVATPGELDTGFVEALRGFRAARADLREQAKTTLRVLQAATQASAATANGKGRAKGASPDRESTGQPACAGAQRTEGMLPIAGAAAQAPQADLFDPGEPS